MSNLSKKIANGDASTYKELYNKTRSKVWYINYLLLCDETAANESTKAVYKNAFSEIADSPEKAESFFDFIEEKAVTYCKIKIAKNNNKEFKIPDSKNFSSFACDERSVLENSKVELAILTNMPSLHRFIYVMSEYLKWSDKKIAEFFHTNEETARVAHEADSANISKIAKALSVAMGKSVSVTKEELTSLIECKQESFDFDVETDRAIILSIDDAIAPIKQKKQQENNKKLKIGAIVSLVVLVIACIVCVVILSKGKTIPTNPTSGDKNNQTTQTDKPSTSKPLTGEGISYKDADAVTNYATIDIENYGKIKLELYGKVAPETVKNFETLANKGFYDGLTFHRIIEEFMMQGGCPNGNGTGGNTDKSGNEINIRGEFEVNGHYNDISHLRGVISMARNGYDYNSGSSQFFIMHEDDTRLDGEYAAFGRVIEGIEIVDAVCEDAEPIDDNGTIPASAQPKIKSVRVEKAK